MAETLARLFRQAISYNKGDAILTKIDGDYRPISSREFQRRVGRLHWALKRVGIQPGDRCALLSENRWEWAAADFAMMTAGFVNVPIYPTLPASQIHYVLEHSESRVALVSTQVQLDKVLEVWEALPKLEGVVAFDPVSCDDERVAAAADLIGDAELTEQEARGLEDSINAVGPDDLASIVYTSGTTGTPKGVMLSHGNLASNVRDCGIEVGPRDVCLSFLPLSHVAERTADYIYYSSGATVAYAESIEAVPLNIRETRPTILLAVPRFFEKLHDRVTQAVDASSAVRRALFRWAIEVGGEASRLAAEGRSMPLGLRPRRALADALVLKKLRGRLGGRLRMMFSGAAPLARHLAEFFHAAGLPIYEAYGLTETSPLVSINRPDAFRFGTVGKPIRNVEARLADDGEILVRGPNVMRGYYKLPEATAETIQDGWLRTGDVGAIDADGYLSITDRKKDLFKTAGGKFVAPQPIESLIKTSPWVSSAVVVAEGRRFPSAIILPNFEKLRDYAAANGIPAPTPADLATRPDVQELIIADVERVCEPLAHHEKPRKFLILDRELTIEDGEITPTMKVRRRALENRLARQIDALYDE